MAIIYGTTNSETVNGTDSSDKIFGWAKGGNENSPSGNDNLSGKGGNDKLYGDIDGGSGNDTLEGGESQIYGGTGSDSLVGDYSNLYGGDGNDTLRAVITAWMEGGNGRDTLIGSGGAGDSDGQDYFVFNTLAEGGDTIKNFVANGDSESRDLIVISASGFGGELIAGTENTPAGNVLAPEQFTTGTGAVDASDRFIYNSANGALFFDIDGTGSTAAVQLATLTGAPAISNSNIVLA